MCFVSPACCIAFFSSPALTYGFPSPSKAGSDSVHTDVDDKYSSVSELHSESSKSSDSSNNQSVNIAGHHIVLYEELTPTYVIKNLVVKPSRPQQRLHGPVTWGGGWHSLTSAKASTQLLLIQQPAMPIPSTSTPSSILAVPQGQVKKGGSHSNLNSYLSILNSYPHISPHPKKDSYESKGPTWVEGPKGSATEGQSQHKRVCIEEEKKEVVSMTSHLLKPQQHHKEGRVHSYSQYKGRGGHSLSTIQHKSHCFQKNIGSDSTGSPSISSSQTPSSPSSSKSASPPSSSPSSSTAHSPYHLPDNSPRQRHFLNTTEILNQLGLLAITLHAKELLKQNAATERDIAQLRQHTHFLWQIAEASQYGCNEGSGSLDKLLQAMRESGSYPNLDLKLLKLHSKS
ncbi:CLOCK-interacting pacemaker-like [Mastacembelus armatus]|uniref:CLOCK-interacting pacemaker-like n=1 Tax=Mastacembelus armatus TaxID=205130 RepID=UPI000E464190|nr:CLOCK-interacting pacemaker-like [Mastacembelus armatus]